MIERVFSNFRYRFFYGDQLRLKIYRNNMYAAGTGTKVTTVFFFVFIMAGSFCDSILQLILAGINTGTGYARQQQQVNTEYEENRFHKAKIIVYKKLCRSSSNYYHNKVAMMANYLTSSSFLYISSTTARFSFSQFCSPFGQLYFWLNNLSASAYACMAWSSL